MNIFSFFSGAGFLDLGFELQGHYNIVFVNEFHEAFNRIYRYARQHMGIAAPRYGHHVEDITDNAVAERKELQSIKKIDSMLSQLKRDHFVSYWN